MIVQTYTLASAIPRPYHVYTHNTRLGKLRGLTETLENKTVYQFRRVPYAKPPISNLRFEKPKQFGSWNGILNATEYGPSCIQYIYDNDKRLLPNTDISEDCLFLNIIAPNDLKNTSRRPVFIWIHGGGFTNGQGMMIDGSVFAATGDVVVVTINYRLNIFGFVNVGKGSPRNLGLWDQISAIQWIKDNIEDYGGDPQTMTIFGESAGGVSVGLQAIIPRNIGLFQRAIAQSGSSLSRLQIVTDSEKLTRKIGGVLNCTECRNGVYSCLECLRNVSAKNLLRAFEDGAQQIHRGFSLKAPIGPFIDGDLIPSKPIHMLLDPNSTGSKMFNSIDFMTGSTDGEGGLLYFNLISEQSNFNFDLKKGIPSRVVCDHIAPFISRAVLGVEGCDNVTRAICNEYSSVSASSSLKQETSLAIDLFGDMEMSSTAEQALYFHSRSRKKSYQYLFTHKPTWGLISERPSWLLGANHADELAFVFGLRRWYPKDVNISSADSELSSRVMSYWLNFGKTG